MDSIKSVILATLLYLKRIPVIWHAHTEPHKLTIWVSPDNDLLREWSNINSKCCHSHTVVGKGSQTRNDDGSVWCHGCPIISAICSLVVDIVSYDVSILVRKRRWIPGDVERGRIIEHSGHIQRSSAGSCRAKCTLWIYCIQQKNFQMMGDNYFVWILLGWAFSRP